MKIYQVFKEHNAIQPYELVKKSSFYVTIVHDNGLKHRHKIDKKHPYFDTLDDAIVFLKIYNDSLIEKKRKEFRALIDRLNDIHIW